MLTTLMLVRTLALAASFLFFGVAAMPEHPAVADDGAANPGAPAQDQTQDDAPPKGGGTSGGGGGGGIDSGAIPRPALPAYKNAEEFLDALEKSIADLASFQARINYTKEDPFASTEMRIGRLLYVQEKIQPAADDGAKQGDGKDNGQGDAEGGDAQGDDAKGDQDSAAAAPDAAPVKMKKRFAVTFEQEIIAGASRMRNQHYIFDGTWLIEIDRDNKQFIKRQVVPPGQSFDPLKLGEGPFPLPIGQPKKEVLARFDVKLIEKQPEVGAVRSRLTPHSVGLELTPKPGLEIARDFSTINIWYDNRTMLPIAVETVGPDGVRKVVLLFDVKKNEPYDESLLVVTAPSADGWAVDIRPWEERR